MGLYWQLLMVLIRNLREKKYTKSSISYQEFRKEIDDQAVLKNKLLAIGKQLSQNKNYNTGRIQERMGWVEQQWELLQRDVAAAEEALHQAQMDLMPSRQALNELGTWLEIMEIAVREEKAKPVKNLADIEVVLKKFKVKIV